MSMADFKAHAKHLLGPDAAKLEPVERQHKGGVLYHISMNPNIREFYPMVTNRTVLNEDRRVPRICVSDSIAGCLSGYANVVPDILGDESNDAWKGGYYVYALPYDIAARPSKDLLASVGETDELWIIGYDQAHRSIKPMLIGQIVPIEHTVANAMGNNPNKAKTSFALRIYDRAHVALDRASAVGWGFHRFCLSIPVGKEFYDIEAAETTQLTEADWCKIKKLNAGLLSYDNSKPSSRW